MAAKGVKQQGGRPGMTEEARHYKLEMEGIANVKEWGAVGDGAADDTAAVEAAIAAVVDSSAGGVVHFPAGAFKLHKRLTVKTHKPFVLRGLGADVSRVLWAGAGTQGITITPSGPLHPLGNDGQVTVTGLSLLCDSDGEPAKSSALQVDGSNQITEMPNGKHNLGCRNVTRVRLTSLAVRGDWKFGIVLRSVHLAEVEHINLSGGKHGSQAAVLIDGRGAPTGHTLENLRVFFFNVGILVRSDVEHGRVEGLKIHNCNIVAVQTGVRCESILELHCVQNHFNCSQDGIVAIDADQCFFVSNLIYLNKGSGNGITLKGKNGSATSHIITSNCIVGVQASSGVTGVALEHAVAGAVVSNNLFNKQHVAIGCGGGDGHKLGHVCCEGNVCRGVDEEFGLPHGPHVTHNSAGSKPHGGGNGGGNGGGMDAQAATSCVTGIAAALRRGSK